MTTLSVEKGRELVINWHVTEACNYTCRYCYAKWQHAESVRELIHDQEGSRRLLSEIYSYFSPENEANPLRREMRWSSVRLNLAGGEPFLYGKRIVETIEVARELGFAVSIISNGSRLSTSVLTDITPHLSVLGISLDSGYEQTNREIGRIDKKGGALPIQDLVSGLVLAKQLNPNLKLKLNTVVNSKNWFEDMSEFVSRLAPAKWKVLRMLPTITDELAVSEKEFQSFVLRHQLLGSIMCVEDNVDMAESYLMIDPHGCFFQNSLGRKGYDYSPRILEVGAAAAFAHIEMSVSKFISRYPATQKKEFV